MHFYCNILAIKKSYFNPTLGKHRRVREKAFSLKNWALDTITIWIVQIYGAKYGQIERLSQKQITRHPKNVVMCQNAQG